MGGWQGQQMDHLTGHGVPVKSGLGAGEEGAGLKTHTNRQELDGRARERVLLHAWSSKHFTFSQIFAGQRLSCWRNADLYS